MKRVAVAIIVLISLGCTGEHTMKQHPVYWLNSSFVCPPFDASRYPKTDPEAVALYEQAVRLSRSAPPLDPVKVAALFLQSAEMGYWAAMHNTAIRYYQGNGFPEDEQKALYWFRQMEQLKIPEGYDSMFLVYYKGIGVQKDRTRAMQYLYKAAQMGDADALVSVAKSLYPQQKFKQAYIALECARQQGHKEAAWELARNYETDDDFEKAYHVYRLGAKMGSGSCLRALSHAYAHRTNRATFGLNKDKKRASCLYKLSDKGDDNPELRFPDLDELCPATVAQPGNRD